MLKLQTPVSFPNSSVSVSLKDKVMVLGSCFADNIGARMVDSGFNVMVNPFGTLYNPLSIADSISRLSSGLHFAAEDCVEMGACAGLICSFHHHTSFARPTADEFLSNANASLDRAHEFWKGCTKVIITLGTSWCFESISAKAIVSNCLKRPAAEFGRFMLSADRVSGVLAGIIGSNPDKQFIFTVSPVRHLADGAHSNQLSKSALLMAADSVHEQGRVEYFPAYEILMDELRDYRFYAEDMVHPSDVAVEYVWERFRDFAVPDSDYTAMAANLKLARQSRHRKLH